MRFDELCIKAGIRGIINVMRHLGMLPGSARAAAHDSVIARNTRWVRAVESGIVTNRVKLGARVTSGEPLATISDPLGDNEVHVSAPFDGIVIGCSNLPLAHEGDALFHIASFSDVPRAEGIVETFAEAHDV